MFEKVLLSALLGSPEFLKKALPHIKEEYFSEISTKSIFTEIKTFVSDFNVAPTKESLIIRISDQNMEEHAFQSTVEAVTELEYNEQNSLEWLIEKSEKFCQEKEIYNALVKSISIADGSDKTLGKNAIPVILQNALGMSFDTSIGHDYFTNAEEQYEYYHNEYSRIPFDVDVLNRITRGGVKDKTLNLVVAGINVGKSTVLLSLAASYLEAGLDVLYISGEMSEEVCRSRIDVRLMGLKSEEVETMSKERYLAKVNDIKSKTQGELIVKEFPPGSFHVGHIRAVVSELKLKKNFKPRVILIDYLGVMASAKLAAKEKANSNTYLGEIATEVRSLAVELEIPIWSAHQVTRGAQGAQSADDIGLDDIAGAISIMAIVDFCFALLVPEIMIPLDQAVLKVLKNRYANKNALNRAVIGLSNDYQKLYDVHEHSQRVIADEKALDQIKQNSKVESVSVSEWVFN